MKLDSIIFGKVHEIKEQTKNPRLIEKRVGEIEVANKNKAKSTKKISKNQKSINHNHTKHL